MTIGIKLDIGNELHFACATGNKDLVTTFLSTERFDLEEKTNSGWSSLIIAIINNNSAIVSTLLKHGADVNAKCNVQTEAFVCTPRGLWFEYWIYNQWTPLHFAAAWNLHGMVEILLAYGANIEGRNSEKYTPFMTAILYNSTKTFMPFIETIEDINADYTSGNTLLTLACYNHNIILASCLLACGADIKPYHFQFLYKNKAALSKTLLEKLHEKYDPILQEFYNKILALNEINEKNSNSSVYFVNSASFIDLERYEEVININPIQSGYIVPVHSLYYLSLKTILSNIDYVMAKKWDAVCDKAKTLGLYTIEESICATSQYEYDTEEVGVIGT